MPYSDIAFVVQTIKTSEGGEKLSFEALHLVIVLAYEVLRPPSQSGIETLLNAHDYIWKDKRLEPHHRLEVCNLLFGLISNLLEEP